MLAQLPRAEVCRRAAQNHMWLWIQTQTGKSRAADSKEVTRVAAADVVNDNTDRVDLVAQIDELLE